MDQRALIEEGVLHKANGDIGKAILYFDEAIRVSKLHRIGYEGICAEALVLKAKIQSESGYLELAILSLTEAIEIARYIGEIYYVRGTCYEALGDIESSKENYVSAYYTDIHSEKICEEWHIRRRADCPDCLSMEQWINEEQGFNERDL